MFYEKGVEKRGKNRTKNVLQHSEKLWLIEEFQLANNSGEKEIAKSQNPTLPVQLHFQ